LDAIEAQVPASLDIHLIMDNYGTHKTAIIRKWFAKRPRFHIHFTPTYGSWINLVEDGSPNSPTSGFAAAHFAASRNWKPLSANTLRSTTKILFPSSGPKRQTRF